MEGNGGIRYMGGELDSSGVATSKVSSSWVS